jgi:ABC-type multidrug transport system fused ATPase/permease subunit
MTIGENIAFGNPEASFDEIQDAARRHRYMILLFLFLGL